MKKLFFAIGFCCAASLALARPLPAQNIKDELENATLLYFLENANLKTGLVRDKAESFALTPDTNNIASIGATGFGLAIIANAAARHKVDSFLGEVYFDKVMRTCMHTLRREHGWFLHWVDWETGQSVWDDANDYSSIDSAFLAAGALYAARIFPRSEGAMLARQLYRDMDFTWFMTDGGRYPQRRTLNIGYSTQRGFTQYQWSIYAEQMILIVLGLGSPTYPLPPEVWTQWERRTFSRDGFAFVAMDMPLFVHQYSQLFLDLRNFQDGYPNYFQTSSEATKYNRFVGNRSIDQHLKPAGFWGFSAGQAQGGSDEAYAVSTPLNHNATACIACAMGSAMFLPKAVLEDARAWRNKDFADQIWGRYGFTDSVNVEHHWSSQKTLGITAGAAYLSLANTHANTSIWREFSQIPEIQAGLGKARRNAPPTILSFAR